MPGFGDPQLTLSGISGTSHSGVIIACVRPIRPIKSTYQTMYLSDCTTQSTGRQELPFLLSTAILLSSHSRFFQLLFRDDERHLFRVIQTSYSNRLRRR